LIEFEGGESTRDSLVADGFYRRKRRTQRKPQADKGALERMGEAGMKIKNKITIKNRGERRYKLG
jgi:hypothetical protein